MILSVETNLLLTVLKELNIPPKLVKLIRSSLMSTVVYVSIEN